MASWFPALVYTLCFLTSSATAILLAISYRRTGARLLLWSAVCFLFLGLNNFVVIIDLLVIPAADFRVARLVFSTAAVSVLLFGFIWDLED